MDFWYQVLKQQSTVEPFSHLPFLGMAEYECEMKNYSQGTKYVAFRLLISLSRYFLMAGTIESKFWTEKTVPAYFTASIKHLITCLCQLQRWAEAIVLHQFAPVINYAEVFRLAREKAREMDGSFLEFIWDVAIYEILVWTYANLHPDEQRLELVVCVAGFQEGRISLL